MNLPPVFVEIIVLIILEVWLWIFITTPRDD